MELSSRYNLTSVRHQHGYKADPRIHHSGNAANNTDAFSQIIYIFSNSRDFSAEHPDGFLRNLTTTLRTVRTRLVKVPSEIPFRSTYPAGTGNARPVADATRFVNNWLAEESLRSYSCRPASEYRRKACSRNKRRIPEKPEAAAALLIQLHTRYPGKTLLACPQDQLSAGIQQTHRNRQFFISPDRVAHSRSALLNQAPCIALG